LIEKHTKGVVRGWLYSFGSYGFVVILPGLTFVESMNCESTHCGY
jgi:hypothetical protein